MKFDTEDFSLVIDRSTNLPFKLCQNKVRNCLALFAKEEKSKQNKGTDQKY